LCFFRVVLTTRETEADAIGGKVRRMIQREGSGGKEEGDTTEEDKSSYLLTADLCPGVWLHYKPHSTRILQTTARSKNTRPADTNAPTHNISRSTAHPTHTFF